MFPQVAAVTVNKTRFEKQQVPAFKSNEDFWGKSLENLPPFTINPFVPNAPCVYPLKNQNTVRFSDVLRGQRKVALGTNELKKLNNIN